jgi:hypothetical protein
MCLPLCLSFCSLLQKVLNYLKEKADQIIQADREETPENGENDVLIMFVCLSVCLYIRLLSLLKEVFNYLKEKQKL